ncbi:hypothetical protein PIB30_030301 [Stylosanthes scabra]|uniref:Uncharacterized protein n=1 Tax=Stylosanthes scabra TaxID=79078 RepID=A0ABU6RC35_9FABA|nr:hypothetical protein [Stylosanthes scabra]
MELITIDDNVDTLSCDSADFNKHLQEQNIHPAQDMDNPVNNLLEDTHEEPDHTGISEEEIPMKGMCFESLKEAYNLEVNIEDSNHTQDELIIFFL